MLFQERSKKALPQGILKKDYGLDFIPIGLEEVADEMNELLNAYREDVKKILNDVVTAFETAKQAGEEINPEAVVEGLSSTFSGIALSYYTKAFALGFSADVNGWLPPETVKFISKAVAQETKYFQKAATRMLARLLEGKDSAIEAIVESYSASLMAQFNNGLVAAMPQRVEIDWLLDKSEKDIEHCPDCLDLTMGSPYTKKTLPTTPKAGDTRCRWRCRCDLKITLVESVEQRHARFVEALLQVNSPSKELAFLCELHRLRSQVTSDKAEVITEKMRSLAEVCGIKIDPWWTWSI